MKTYNLILILSLLAIVTIAQSKFNHEYRIKLKSQVSIYSTQIKKSSIRNNQSYLKFIVTDCFGRSIEWPKIRIKGIDTDTSLISDINGKIDFYLSPGQSTIFISSVSFTPLEFKTLDLLPNTSYTFTVNLGYSNKLSIKQVHSKRELSTKEIEKLIDDLSRHRKEENELIKNRICYILSEI